MPKESTEIVPDFREFSTPIGGNRITILLQKKPEITKEILRGIEAAFNSDKIGDFKTYINPQEEKYWVKV